MARPYHRRLVLTVSRAYSHDPLERINTLAGLNSDRSPWRLSQAAAIAAIEARTDEFYVADGAREVKVLVYTEGGQKYLTTEGAKSPATDVLNGLLR